MAVLGVALGAGVRFGEEGMVWGAREIFGVRGGAAGAVMGGIGVVG